MMPGRNGDRTDTPYGRSAFWIFVAFAVFYVAITRGHFVSTDEVAVYHQARSLWEHGNLATAPILNTVPGRDGLYYAPYNAGQSIAALPLYGLGKAVGQVLQRAGRPDWIATFAGPVIGAVADSRWSGDMEIFFVNLFNCFTTGLLCAVFFAFSLRIGAAPRWAFAAAALLGLTSHVTGFSTSFFQHPAEALLLTWAFYFLFSDARRPSWKSRAFAGAAVATMLLVRFPSAIALPGLSLYLLWSLWQRRLTGWRFGRHLAWMLVQVLPFAIPVAVGLGLCVAINYFKFGAPSLAGSYAQTKRFDSPLLVSLFGFLLSPGESIFIFTPLLVLTPWYLRHFARQYRAETLFILLLAASYLVFYGKADLWHGQWCFGPRYLLAIVPPLLLPLGCWMQHHGRSGCGCNSCMSP